MLIPKKTVRSYLELIGAGLLCIGMISLCNNAWIQVASFWLLCATAVVISGFNLLHPYFSFSVVFSLYSTSNAIMYLLGNSGYAYSKEQILYAAVALLCTLIVVGPQKVKIYCATKTFPEENVMRDYAYLDTIILIFSVLIVAFSIILLRRGYSGKTAMKEANDIFYRLGIYLARYDTICIIIRCYNRHMLGKKYTWHIVAGMIASVLFGLVTGERDTYLRFGICIVFLLYSCKVISTIHLMIIGPAAVGILSVSTVIKYYLTRGVLYLGSSNLLEQFLSSDFICAGRNLQYLLDRNWTKGYFGLYMLFTELFYPVIPSAWKVNPDHWFNYEVHTGSYHGYAFSLVGTGYIIGGLAGVILVFIIVGLMLRVLYSHSGDSTYAAIVYIYMLTIVMVSFRQSLSTITNSSLKEITFTMVLFAACNTLIRKRNSNPIPTIEIMRK